MSITRGLCGTWDAACPDFCLGTKSQGQPEIIASYPPFSSSSGKTEITRKKTILRRLLKNSKNGCWNKWNIAWERENSEMSKLNYSAWKWEKDRTVSLLMTAHIPPTACWSFRLISRCYSHKLFQPGPTELQEPRLVCTCGHSPECCPQPIYRREHFSVLVLLPLTPASLPSAMKMLSDYLSSAFPLLHVQNCLQNSGTMGTLTVPLSHVPGDLD